PGVRVLLYRNIESEVTQRQLIAASDTVFDPAPLTPLIARVRQTGQETAETVSWPDGTEMVDAIPLAGTDRRVVGILLVGSSGRALGALVRSIRWTGAAVAGLGIFLGLAISYVVASRVTRPVEQLASATREIADGNWNVQLDDIRSTAEIAALGSAFET